MFSPFAIFRKVYRYSVHGMGFGMIYEWLFGESSKLIDVMVEMK